VANYRQTVLSAFQAVEDNLSSLRILAQEIQEQQTAIDSAAHYLDLALVRYKSGVDSYLNVITAQNAVLSNRETQVQAQAREMLASVSLVLALGGGWDRSQLPAIRHLADKQRGWQPGGAALPVTNGATGKPNPPVVQPESIHSTQSNPPLR
jgi:outer membrane protein TolC